jgi:small subunit ribosomal protein S20
MPITKSTKKTLRKSLKRAVQNAKKMRGIKDLLKEIKVLISQKKNEEAKKLLPQVYKALDKAAKTGLIKKNKAGRTKSRLAKQINKK